MRQLLLPCMAYLQSMYVCMNVLYVHVEWAYIRKQGNGYRSGEKGRDMAYL